jgi:peptidoglycan/LPS O-acetylase OafA/YrhL
LEIALASSKIHTSKLQTFDNTPVTVLRSNGLDTLRALAIALVFMYHYMVFVTGEPTFGWLSTIGWVGVDLFFVLSGYLIGQQIFAGVVAGGRLSLSAFYVRRAMRTWPVFWVVLAAYFLFPSAMGGRTPPPLWAFLTFTQNYQLQPGTAFSHAWSLCIEEQFYLVLPLVVVLALRVGTRRTQAWLFMGGLLACGVLARGVLWSQYGREDFGAIEGFYPHIYYATLCRFDEFLPGIAVAMVRNFHPQLWEKVMQAGRLTFVTGVLAVLAALYGVYHCYSIDGYGYGFFMSVFGYSLIAMAFSILVVSALSARSPLHGVRIPGAYHLAVWSYSIYLSHKAVAFIIHQQAAQWMLSPIAKLLVIVPASLSMGAMLYRWVEQPLMRMRERRFPQIFDSP